jgi:hypothetical protein
MESAVSALWGFDGFAWSAVAALMRLTGGNDAVGVTARLAGAVPGAAWPLQSGRFRRDEVCGWCCWTPARKAGRPPRDSVVGGDEARW